MAEQNFFIDVLAFSQEETFEAEQSCRAAHNFGSPRQFGERQVTDSVGDCREVKAANARLYIPGQDVPPKPTPMPPIMINLHVSQLHGPISLTSRGKVEKPEKRLVNGECAGNAPTTDVKSLESPSARTPSGPCGRSSCCCCVQKRTGGMRCHGFRTISYLH